MSITRKFENKVMGSTQVSLPHPEMQNNALNRDLARNPSQANGNSPPRTPRTSIETPSSPARQLAQK
jgi:hypothetical protein